MFNEYPILLKAALLNASVEELTHTLLNSLSSSSVNQKFFIANTSLNAATSLSSIDGTSMAYTPSV